MTNKILEVKNLETSFYTHVGEVKAVRDVSFSLKEGEILGIVGESGSGKSVTSMSIMRLLSDSGKIKNGEILFKGQDLVKLSEKELRKIRGNKITMIFQDPMTSLNPLYSIGDQIEEIILEHKKVSKSEARKRTIEMLEMVGIPGAKKRVNYYPSEFSGGMRQRVMIAMALACEPDLLIADEPTTALDVTIQAQVLRLIKNLNAELNTATILITHDLGVVASTCQNVLVMYGGQIMEMGSDQDIFYRPRHPYTMGLLKSVPKLRTDDKERLSPIAGSTPDMLNPPSGCPFYPRCDYAMKICKMQEPEYFEVGENHKAKCWLLHENAPQIPEYEAQKGGVKNE
ncbi:MAG: ABC transporter ATP-binding protein [Tissierellia bacterium]|nr:ABC transporter ATP-binding protein [Tissierellia bacterium]